MNEQWKPGDWAVYRKSKQSRSPGPRAAKVVATPKGETYAYVVDKFWVVENVLPDNRLELRTARGKTHLINADDPSLRKPSWRQTEPDRARTPTRRDRASPVPRVVRCSLLCSGWSSSAYDARLVGAMLDLEEDPRGAAEGAKLAEAQFAALVPGDLGLGFRALMDWQQARARYPLRSIWHP